MSYGEKKKRERKVEKFGILKQLNHKFVSVTTNSTDSVRIDRNGLVFEYRECAPWGYCSALSSTVSKQQSQG